VQRAQPDDKPRHADLHPDLLKVNLEGGNTTATLFVHQRRSVLLAGETMRYRVYLRDTGNLILNKFLMWQARSLWALMVGLCHEAAESVHLPI
jgi:hypothetical protein